MPVFATNARYSNAIKEAYASAPVEVILIHTLEIRHPSFTSPVRIVRDAQPIAATLESDAPVNPGATVTFQAMFFDFTLPSEVDTEAPEVELKVVNVGRLLMAQLDAAVQSSVPIEITYRPYLTTDLTAPHMKPPLTLTMRSIDADLQYVTARCGYGSTSNRKFPSMVYSLDKFPGLVQR